MFVLILCIYINNKEVAFSLHYKVKKKKKSATGIDIIKKFTHSSIHSYIQLSTNMVDLISVDGKILVQNRDLIESIPARLSVQILFINNTDIHRTNNIVTS